MEKSKNHSLNYYYLNKNITLKYKPGYRQTILNVLMHKDKFLFVQEKGGFWGFTRQGVVKQNVLENLFETMVRNFGEELGFKGFKVKELSPKFTPVAYLFNFDAQQYDAKRAASEERKNRPTKGKLYHLAIIEYSGPTNLPIDTKDKHANIKDYKWVNAKEGRHLTKENNKAALELNKEYSVDTINYHFYLYEKVIKTYEYVKAAYSFKIDNSVPLFSETL